MNHKEERPWAGGAKRWLVLFGIPIIIFLIGAWQWSRADHQTGPDPRIAEYQQAISQLKALEASTGGRSMAVVTDDKGKRVSASLMRQRYERALAELQGDSFDVITTSRHLQPTLALCTMVFSALALLWTLVGVLYQKRMGREAMESRAQLLATFERGRKLLPTYMVVMVLLLFGAAIPLLVYEIMPILRHNRYSRGDMKLVLLLAGVALFLLYSGVKVLWSMWQASRMPLANEPIEVMGQAVTREQVPQLWSFVDRVVSHTGAGTPDHIVVGLNEGFFVTEHPVKLRSGSQLPKGRVLYLPLPYMAFMSSAEVAGVIGHELGHFIGEDTVYSQRFSPIYSATVSHIVAVAGGPGYEESWLDVLRKPATLFGEMFLDSFHEAVSYWSRQRELAADAVGASVSHPIAIALSLLRITALEPRVNEALGAHWDQGRAVEGGVLAHVRQLVQKHGMQDPSEHLQNRQSHPTDTHPELIVRLEALGVAVTPGLLERAMNPQASSLLQELGLEGAVEGAGAGGTVDVSSALQQEMSDVSASARAEKVEALSAMVQAAAEPVPVHERVTFMLLASVGIALLLLGVGLAFFIKGDVANENRIWGAPIIALALMCAAWGVWLFKRSRQPVMVIRAEGLQLFQNADLLPWNAIDDFAFTETDHTFVVRLDLDKQAPPPRLSVSKLRASVNTRKNEVTVTLLGVGGKRAEAVSEAMVGAWRAHFAAEELARMRAQG